MNMHRMPRGSAQNAGAVATELGGPMQTLPIGDGHTFHAMTGQAAYDSVRFSGNPVARLLASNTSPVQAVRHLGLAGVERGSSTSYHDDVDVLTLNLTASGEYRANIGGERSVKQARRDQVGFVPAGIDIALEYAGTHSALIMYLPKAMLRGVLDELGHGALRPIQNEMMPQLAQLMRLAERELMSPGFASTMMLETLFRAIGTGIIQFDTTRFDSDAERVHLPPVKIKRILDYIEAHIDSDISLNDLASVAGLSPFHFSRVFKRAKGETPCQFVRSRRLEYARSLLAKTEMPLAELSLQCGFANQSHFTAAFTRALGVSPARYWRLVAR